MFQRLSHDRVLFITATLLTLFGLVMVYSASSPVSSAKFGTSSYYFLRQLGYALFGYIALLVLMSIDYHVWQKERVVRWLIVACVVLLLAVFTQPTVNHARRWLRHGSVSFQPSEAAKLVLLIFLAFFLHRYGKDINRLKGRLLPCLGVAGLLAILIAREPDLGQAACIVAITALMLFIAGLRWRYILVAMLAAAPAFYYGVRYFDFRWNRVRVLFDPFYDPLRSGWNITQSLTAIGSGGIGGLGLGAGKQKLFYLPEAASDFIFAVISEELGFIGASLVVLLFCVFFFCGMRIALRAPDAFGHYLGLGITTLVVTQAFVNISMAMSMLPTKGMALPFLSQGGSSLLVTLTATGILLNIAQQGERA